MSIFNLLIFLGQVHVDMLVDVPISEVMTTDVVTVEPGVSVREAARMIREQDIGSLVVVEDGRPVGLLTDKVLLDLLIEAVDFESVAVEDHMIAPLVTVDAGESVEAAAERMKDNRIKRLPVTRDGGLAGIVTTTDLSYYLPTMSMRDSSDRVDWDFAQEGLGDLELDVGDAVSFSKSLDDGDVRAFAEASGDINELHLSGEYAAETRFGQRIVHGVLVLGVISAAISRLPGTAIYLSQKASFRAPVGVGEEVTAECRVVEYLGNDKYSLSTDVYCSDELVVEGEATVLLDAAPSAQE